MFMAGIESGFASHSKPVLAYVPPSLSAAGGRDEQAARTQAEHLFVERRQIGSYQQFTGSLSLLVPDLVGIGWILPRVVWPLPLAAELKGVFERSIRLEHGVCRLGRSLFGLSDDRCGFWLEFGPLADPPCLSENQQADRDDHPPG